MTILCIIKESLIKRAAECMRKKTLLIQVLNLFYSHFEPFSQSQVPLLMPGSIKFMDINFTSQK